MARWRRAPSDLTTLGPLQRRLLDSALDATVPGGVVAYATCSPHLAETVFVVADVLKRRSDVEPVEARGLFRDRGGAVLDDLGAGPAVQLWPHRHGTDAMFFALLRRLREAVHQRQRRRKPFVEGRTLDGRAVVRAAQCTSELGGGLPGGVQRNRGRGRAGRVVQGVARAARRLGGVRDCDAQVRGPLGGRRLPHGGGGHA